MREKKGNIAWSVLLLLLLIVWIYCFVGIQEQKENGTLFFPFGYRPVVILSGSMEPAIQSGAVVIVRQTKDIEQEEIIFFISQDRTPVIHRCVEVIDNEYYVTKGDANKEADFELVSQEQIQGKVVYVMNWLAPVFTKNQGIFS